MCASFWTRTNAVLGKHIERLGSGDRFSAAGYRPSAVKALECVSAERLDIARRLGGLSRRRPMVYRSSHVATSRPP